MSTTPSPRFKAPLWSSNGFTSCPFKKKEKREARALKAAAKKEKQEAAPSKPTVDPTPAQLPVLHVFAEGKRKDVMVVPRALRDACGADAAILMGEISTHAATFQHNYHSLAGRTGMGVERIRSACRKLTLHGYAARVTVKGGGTTLQTNANGGIVPLTAAACHYAYADPTRAPAARRKAMRRRCAGIVKQRREKSPKRASNLDVVVTPSETGGSENPSLASLIMITQKEKENNPQTPLADATRGLSDFFVEPLGVLGFDAAQVLASLETPELKEKYPMGEEEERFALEALSACAQIQAGNVHVQHELHTFIDLSCGYEAPTLDPAKKVLSFDAGDFANWRRSLHLWGEPLSLRKDHETEDALDLADPDRNPAAPLKSTLNNLIARAMLAPKLFAPSPKPSWNTDEPNTDRCFHEGYTVLSAHTDVFSAPDDSVELGLAEMPLRMTQGANALLWLQTHRVGLLFLSCLPNPEALTVTHAAQLVRRLRKGTLTSRHIFRMWLLTHYSSMQPDAENVCEILLKRGKLELHSDEAIEGYRDALKRLTNRNTKILPNTANGKFRFSKEEGETEEGETEDDVLAESVLAESMARGKQLIAGFEEGWELSRDVELALRHVFAAGALNEDDMGRLACLWLQANVDQNESLLQKLNGWGAQQKLHGWATDHTAGRRWLIKVAEDWEFTHLPELAQMLGWASHAEWWQLNKLRQYAMQNAWDAFIDTRGNHHTIWTNSLLDRYDVNNTK
jgi:hypothetical protein